MINYYKTKGVFVLELSNEITLTTLADIRSRIDSLNLQQYPMPTSACRTAVCFAV